MSSKNTITTLRTTHGTYCPNGVLGTMSKKENEVQLTSVLQNKAAITIQRSFRNHLYGLNSTTIKLIETTKGIFKNQQISDKSKWESMKSLAKSLKGDYYVFAHGASHTAAFVTDLVYHLNLPHNRLFPQKSHFNRSIRPNNLEMLFANTTEYFTHSMSRDTDHTNRAHVLSCDGYLDNKDDFESAFFYFTKNQSIGITNSLTINRVLLINLIKNYLHNPTLRSFACNCLDHIFTHNLSALRSKQGRVYLIAIPKRTLRNPDKNYVWRAHQFGVPCTCHCATKTFSHKQFLQTLKKHQKGKVSLCTVFNFHNNNTNPQYRILTANLDRDLHKKIIVLDSFSDKEQMTYKRILQQLVHIMKGCQALESVSESTTEKELVDCLLLLQFDLKELKTYSDKDSIENKKLYKKGLQAVLFSKAAIFLKHADYLKDHLPKRVLDKLKKIWLNLHSEKSALTPSSPLNL